MYLFACVVNSYCIYTNVASHIFACVFRIAAADDSVDSALELSCWMGHEKMVAVLLQHGAFFGRSIHYAAKAGHTYIVEKLLESKAHPEVQDGTIIHTHGFTRSDLACASRCIHADV